MPHHCNMALFSFIDWNDFHKTSQSHDEQTLMTNGSEKNWVKSKTEVRPEQKSISIPNNFFTIHLLLFITALFVFGPLSGQ